jgi:hypothetical protein
MSDRPAPPRPEPRLPNPGTPQYEHWSQALYPIVIAAGWAVIALALILDGNW